MVYVNQITLVSQNRMLSETRNPKPETPNPNTLAARHILPHLTIVVNGCSAVQQCNVLG
jgi:hypothetical protein